MPTFTSTRLLNGHHRILCDGKPVGEAWRYPPRPRGSRARGASGRFGMRLDGFLWTNRKAVRLGERCGFTTISVPLLRDALALAEATLAATGRS